MGQRLVGGGLLIGGALLAMALASYTPGDPSINTATSSPAANALGSIGAMISDILLQTVGLASILPVLCLVVWGARLMAAQTLTLFWLRVLMAPVATVLVATGFGIVPESWFWPLTGRPGGFTGMLLLDLGSHLLRTVGTVGIWRVTIALGAWVLGFVTLLFTLGTGLSNLSDRLRILASAPRQILNRIRQGQILARHHETPAGTTPPTLEEEAAEPVDDEHEPVATPPSEGGDITPEAPAARRRATPARRSTSAEQPALDLGQSRNPSGHVLPALDLLAPPAAPQRTQKVNEEAMSQNARSLETVLQDFGVNGRIVKVRPGPVVTLYELEPAPGTKTSRVIGLADDIARSMSALAVRIAVVPGQSVIGIELPNLKRETVFLREMLAANSHESGAGRLMLALGKDIGGAPMNVDLARMPHVLIAGTTGSGKSVAINTMILSLLYRLTPADCRLIMIDPKMLELSVYDGIPHLLAPVVTDPGKAVVALKWAVKEMENRYRAMSQLGVRNIAGYNQRVLEARQTGQKLNRTVQTGFDPETGKPIYEEQGLALDPLPFIVVVVDEMADLMLVAGKDVEAAIQRLAQMARAAGIHIIMATQRPSVDVITGTIKANFPSRISFQVTSKIDSRTILGEQGAEQLLGQGDMLYMAAGGRITRVHGPFVSDAEVENVVKYLRTQGEPRYVEAVTVDEDEAVPDMGEERDDGAGNKLYKDAVAIVLRERKASTSFIQRQLQIGYNRAAKLMERMENEGIISQANHVGKREILSGKDRP
ncbi:MAG: DNA translocase FtsK 4TM domain-containing protein [Alphaproteobacteria bacterium]|nr:DNA translocase FtsK 4TM domain-containing protein [Alphaproteobacteria bacterium]